MTEEVQTVKKQNWFAKHKVLTVIGIVLLLGAIGSAADGGGSGTSSTPKDSTAPTATQETAATAEAPMQEEPAVPAEYRSALNKAKSYAETMHMSKAGIYDQLTSEYGEKFSPEAAQYAIDTIQTDWNAHALAKAKSYQDKMSISPAAIRDQLTSSYGEKFTTEEAEYAVAHLND